MPEVITSYTSILNMDQRIVVVILSYIQAANAKSRRLVRVFDARIHKVLMCNFVDEDLGQNVDL